jgi:hypothetical protein
MTSRVFSSSTRAVGAVFAYDAGLTLVAALLEHARDEGATHPVVVHEQDVHVRGGGARHRVRTLRDVTRCLGKQPPTLARASSSHAPSSSLPPRVCNASPVSRVRRRSRRSEPTRVRAGRLGRAPSVCVEPSWCPPAHTKRQKFHRDLFAIPNKRRGTVSCWDCDSQYLASVEPLWSRDDSDWLNQTGENRHSANRLFRG